MLNKYLIGNKKKGCLIDNDNEILIYYESLSLYEKLSGKKQEIKIRYQDIESISIGYSIINGVRWGTVSLFLNVHCPNNIQYQVPILYMNTEKEDIRNFIRVLNASPLSIIDHYNILHKILTSDELVGTIVSQVDEIRKKA